LTTQQHNNTETRTREKTKIHHNTKIWPVAWSFTYVNVNGCNQSASCTTNWKTKRYSIKHNNQHSTLPRNNGINQDFEKQTVA